MKKYQAVILAGGSGERFWPLSTAEKPKQFLRVFGGSSLIRQSVERLEGVVAPENTYVVTSRELVGATHKELQELAKDHIIGEPMRRDTGAAIALGVGLARAEDEAVIGFFSSDQLVRDVKAFQKVIQKAYALAAKTRQIVVIGIPPDHPSSSYGYVDPKTGKFVEKPTVARARTYLRKGYLWNAGMFIAQAGVFREAIAAYAPALEPLTRGNVPQTAAGLTRLYEALPRISFDFAVMEKATNVSVIPGDFGWDDVGNFGAFDTYFPHDADGNVREGPCTVVDSEKNICVARSARISLLGVKNLVVVTTPDYVLVADKKHLKNMKKLVHRNPK